MPDERNRIAENTVGEVGNRDRFHQGKNPQILPADLTEEEQAALDLHRATIHAPESKPQWGYDEDGNPIEVGPQGLIVTDPVTGEVEPLSEDSLARAEQVRSWRAEREERGLTGGTPPERGPRRGPPKAEGSPEAPSDPAAPAPPPPAPPEPTPAPPPPPPAPPRRPG